MTQKSMSPYRGYWVFLIPGVLVFLLLIVLPFIVNIGASFTRWTGVGNPVVIGFANYQKAAGDSAFWTSFKNNLSLIIVLTTIPTLIGLLLAVILSDFVAKRFGNTVASLFRAGFYLPQIIPVIVAALVWRWVLQPEWGILNTFLKSSGLEALAQSWLGSEESVLVHNWLGDRNTALGSIMAMLVWFQIGYPLVIFMAGLQRLDPELYEAAQIDGAAWLQRFIHITIPLLRPELYVVTLTTTIYALKTFGPIYMMTQGGPGTATMVASYFSYKNFFENSNVGYGATMATVLTMLIIILTIFYIRVQTQQERRENL